MALPRLLGREPAPGAETSLLINEAGLLASPHKFKWDLEPWGSPRRRRPHAPAAPSNPAAGEEQPQASTAGPLFRGVLRAATRSQPRGYGALSTEALQALCKVYAAPAQGPRLAIQRQPRRAPGRHRGTFHAAAAGAYGFPAAWQSAAASWPHRARSRRAGPTTSRSSSGRGGQARAQGRCFPGAAGMASRAAFDGDFRTWQRPSADRLPAAFQRATRW